MYFYTFLFFASKMYLNQRKLSASWRKGWQFLLYCVSKKHRRTVGAQRLVTQWVNELNCLQSWHIPHCFSKYFKVLSSWCHLPTIWLDFLFHHSISVKVNVRSLLGSHPWDICLHPRLQESLMEYSWVFHGKMSEAPPSCSSPPLLALYLALLWASICQNQLLITSKWQHLS